MSTYLCYDSVMRGSDMAHLTHVLSLSNRERVDAYVTRTEHFITLFFLLSLDLSSLAIPIYLAARFLTIMISNMYIMALEKKGYGETPIKHIFSAEIKCSNNVLLSRTSSISSWSGIQEISSAISRPYPAIGGVH